MLWLTWPRRRRYTHTSITEPLLDDAVTLLHDPKASNDLFAQRYGMGGASATPPAAEPVTEPVAPSRYPSTTLTKAVATGAAAVVDVGVASSRAAGVAFSEAIAGLGLGRGGAGPSAGHGAGADWSRDLDTAGRRALGVAQSKLARATPMGSPVGQTPAGNYVGLYWQYGRTHVVPAQALSCTSTVGTFGTVGTIAGNGFDDVGDFRVSGTYNGPQLTLTKRYIRGTGDPVENRGHSVALRLTLCDLHAVLAERSHELRQYGAPVGAVGFYGTWHVRTRGYNGDAEMVLWLPPLPVVIGHVISSSAVMDHAHVDQVSEVSVVSGVPVGSGAEDGYTPPSGVAVGSGAEDSGYTPPAVWSQPEAPPSEDDQVDALRAAFPLRSTDSLREMVRTGNAPRSGPPWA